MQDFIQEGQNNNISIDNLAFGQFVTVLQEDIKFDSTKDAISYSCGGDITVPIANERSWKAAMGEMYIRGLDRFVFNIEERSEYSRMPATLVHILRRTRSNHRIITYHCFTKRRNLSRRCYKPTGR